MTTTVDFSSIIRNIQFCKKSVIVLIGKLYYTKANWCSGLFFFFLCTLSNVPSELQSTPYTVSIDYVRQSWGGERGLLRVNYNNNNITELAVHTGPTLAEACGSSDLCN